MSKFVKRKYCIALKEFKITWTPVADKKIHKRVAKAQVCYTYPLSKNHRHFQWSDVILNFAC